MPAADDLFRPTVVPDAPDTPDEGGPSDAQPTAEGKSAAKRAPSGRVRHDEKMTSDLEQNGDDSVIVRRLMQA